MRSTLTKPALLVMAALCASGPAAAQEPDAAAPEVVQAPVLKWQKGGCGGSSCQTGWYASPAVTDLDGDGLPDVVWASYDLVALNGATGSLKWRSTNNLRTWPGIAIVDLEGNGAQEIVVGRGGGAGNQLVVYNSNGSERFGRKPFTNSEVRSLAIADLEGDGQFEMVVGRASSGGTLQVSVYEPDGSVRPGWPARHTGEAGFGAGMYNENLSVSDVNGDGFREVFAPTDVHYITYLERDGSQILANSLYGANKVWAQVGVHVLHSIDLQGFANCGDIPPAPLAERLRPNFANSAPVTADVDGDGTLELVVIGDVYDCDLGDPAGDLYHLPFILKRDRTRWSGSGFDWSTIPAAEPGSGPISQDFNEIENSVQNVVVADLDGDGRKEILYPSYDGRLHAYWLDKTEHGNWPFAVTGPGTKRFASEPVVADLDNDGHAEVIFTSWPDKASGAVGKLFILDYLGNVLQSADLPPSFPSGSYNGGLGAPTLANIDADADLEVVVGTVNSGVVAYDLPGTANARILWGTGRGSQRRAGMPELLERPPANFLGDRQSETVVYSGGAWLRYDRAAGTFQSGVFTGNPGGCIPAPMDHDGDGRLEYTQLCNGAWHFYNDDGSYLKGIWTGSVAGDLPVPADYDGDGKDDVVVWRNGAWLFYDFATGAFKRGVFTGNPTNHVGGTNVPLPMDYDGDGTADFTVYAGGAWHFFNHDGSYRKGIWTGSIAGDVPVPADYSNGRRDEPVLFRAGAWLFYDYQTGNYLSARSVFTGQPPHVNGGTSLPAPLDYDGDGKADFTVFAGGPWHFFNGNGTLNKVVATSSAVGTQAISRRQLP
jgi:phage baseplate assembly protein gpV